MSTSLFPDVNVWLALAHVVHPQHAAALAWVESVGTTRPVCFCRFTQLGLLRILTLREAMREDVLTQAGAWQIYDLFLENPNAQLVEEPPGVERRFREHTDRDDVSPKVWADAYLASFAEASGFTLVTFDKALAKRVRGALLLRAR